MQAYLKENRHVLPLLAWAAAYAGLLFFFKADYLFGRLNFLLGLAFAPLVTRRVSASRSWAFGILSLLCGGLLALEQGNMAYYFCAGFGLLFLLETAWGKLNRLPVLLIVVMSPVFQYIADVWSFPIRLKMSEIAGQALQLAGMKAEVIGNSILLDGEEFSVDPACMGLNLLTTSLLIGILLLGHAEKKTGSVFSWWEASAWLVLALVLSLVSNFNRLLVLVLFRIPPENPMHDAWGMVGLVLYVVLPLFLLLRWRQVRLKRQVPATPQPPVCLDNRPAAWAVRLAILAILAVNGKAPDHEPAFAAANLADHQLEGFKNTLTRDGVLKLENDSLLVYIKPPSGFLRASHDPRICWQGSGYTFKRVQKGKLHGVEVYTAILEKGKDQLHTAWWYDNGVQQTVEEWEWRWAGLLGGGGGYRLINITCPTQSLLEESVGKMNVRLGALGKPTAGGVTRY